MCTRVQIEYPNSKSLCATVGEMIAELGHNLVRHSGYAEVVTDEHCLCPIDLPATAKRCGYVVVRAPNGEGVFLPGDVIFRPAPDPVHVRRGT